MTKAMSRSVIEELPLAPRTPLPLRVQLRELRNFHTGPETFRDAGGPVTRIKLAPSWMMPEIVLTTSPRGAHDVLGTSDAIVERTAIHHEMRSMIGANLFDVPHDEWLPRRRLLQPLFTKRHVRDFGGPMAEAAETIAASWGSDAEVDLDVQCRKLTLRALGRSVLGLDLDVEVDRIAKPLQVMLAYVADRGTRPVRMPSWMPTPARRRAEAASAQLRDLASDVLAVCRQHADVDAPLVRSLIDARDPSTGKALSDDDIRDELIVFMGAGHDTTATTMAYALWQLGRNPAQQDRLRAEVDAVGDRRLTPDDLGRLPYTVQVLHEALRLCPPGAMNTRFAMQDIEVDGYRVKAGSFVAVGVYAMQRDPALWERATEFDPDRFAPESAKRIDRWQYLPFGAGPRTCVGDHFAMLELALALATILQHSMIQSLDPDFPMATPFTTVAAAPIRARVTHRQVMTT